jgi:hypothetical protein
MVALVIAIVGISSLLVSLMVYVGKGGVEENG